ncbi:hypothetical protein C7212DRAFT_161959 [Tuber magnatum]|uniref:PiggyBac transposable element-derived protein domain-containing protein n=1 Tax=Tuber magnatum TaxID=42249 RepID=A0A317T2Q6_9PEZI|nr:hypothetical protein C7212DRAFT_161959 [Tuber magnatum]
MRRWPRTTSTNTTLVRKVFGDQAHTAFFIPTVIDDYNHHMEGVDIADQRRAAFTTHQHAQQNWLAFFYFFLRFINYEHPHFDQSYMKYRT